MQRQEAENDLFAEEEEELDDDMIGLNQERQVAVEREGRVLDIINGLVREAARPAGYRRPDRHG